MKRFAFLIFILCSTLNAGGGVPDFLDRVDTSPLRHIGIQQGGRVVPLAGFASDFTTDLHGTSPMRIQQREIDPIALLLECVLVPERALEWCEVASRGRSSPRLAGDALSDLAFGVASNEADAERTGEDAVLEARLMLLVFAAEEFRVVPPASAKEEWLTCDKVSDSELAAAFDRLRAAWMAGDAPIINESIATIARRLTESQAALGIKPLKLKAELTLARAHPLTVAIVLYALAAMLSMVISGTGWARAIMLLGLLVHLSAMTVRALVLDRVPIQNHYESMLAVAALVTMGVLVYTARHPNATLVSIGALMSAAMLAAAEWLDVPGRVLELEAGILSSTAILKYHVLTILAGYALILLGAGVSGAVLYRRSRGASLEQVSSLHRLQVGIGFWVFWVLGLGILLGAVWADRAWGRWWAFDPKETWALITWLVYLTMVHIPASKLAAHRRPVVVALLHLLGLLAMLWTYFGVNLLLPSLHSYA